MGIQFTHKDVQHIAWNWEDIKTFCKNGYQTKKDLIEKTGLEMYTFDYALPQHLVNAFIDETGMEYDKVISTCVYVYSEENRQGVMLSCNDEIQIMLDQWYSGDFD